MTSHNDVKFMATSVVLLSHLLLFLPLSLSLVATPVPAEPNFRIRFNFSMKPNFYRPRMREGSIFILSVCVAVCLSVYPFRL